MTRNLLPESTKPAYDPTGHSSIDSLAQSMEDSPYFDQLRHILGEGFCITFDRLDASCYMSWVFRNLQGLFSVIMPGLGSQHT